MKDLTEYLRGVKDRLAKATPGPWAFGYKRGDKRTDGTDWGADGLWGEGKLILGSGPGWDSSYQEPSKPNAELIASAPSDLATLTEICETLMGVVDKFSSARFSHGDAMEIARQAKVRVSEILEGKK